MISAGQTKPVNKNRVQELNKYLRRAICLGMNVRLPGTPLIPVNTQCAAKLKTAVNDSVAKYKLTEKYRRHYFASQVRRMATASGMFRSFDRIFAKHGSITISTVSAFNKLIQSYILNPSASNPNTLINVYSPIDGKMHPGLTFVQVIDLCALIASKVGVKKKDIIVIPPPLADEIDLIKTLPPGWRRDRNIERVVRLYLETKKELEHVATNKGKYNDDKVALEVIQGVRRIAFKAANPHRPVPAKGVKITDAAAKATYKKFDHLRGPGFDAKSKEFLWAMTNTFVRMAKIKTTGTGPAAKHEVDIALMRAKGIRDAINLPSTDKLSTHVLMRTSKTLPLPKTSLRKKIEQADIIRDQTVKAFKRLLWQEKKAGIASPATATGYAANRAALNRIMLGKMIAATIRGMRDTFEKHFASKTATDVTLRELEARGVQLVKGGKDPHMVLFKLSLHKSTAGAPLTEVVMPIVNGHRGNRTLRYAVAVRRYQDAKILLDKKFKDPKVRAAKIGAMKKSLVDGLKGLSDDKLLLSAVVSIDKDGKVKIKLAPKMFIKYANPKSWLGKQRKALEGLGNIRRPKANSAADAYVDIIDRSKFIFKQIIDSKKSELQGKDGKLDPKKLQALVEALVKFIRKLQIHHKDRTGSRWTHTGKDATFKIKSAMVPEPIKDRYGNVIGRRMVPGFKVTDLKLKKRFGEKGTGGNGLSFAFPLNEAKTVILGGSVELDASVGAATPDKKSEAKPKPEWNAVGAVDVKVAAHLKFKRAWNAKLSVDGAIKSYHMDASMEAALDPNEPHGTRWPSTLPEGGDSSWGYAAKAGLSIEPKVSETLKLKVEARGGIVAVQAGPVSTLGRSTAVGGGLSAILAGKRFSLGASLMAGRPNKPVFGKDKETGKSNAWMDKGAIKLAVNLVASGVLIPGTLAFAASYGFSKLSNPDALDEDGDGTLDGTPRLSEDGITPLSVSGKCHAISAGATLGLIKDAKKKPRLVITASGSGIFGTNDVTSGMMGMTMLILGLTVAGIVHPRVLLFGGLNYTHLKLKGEWPSGNPNTEDTGGGAFDVTKSGVSGKVGILVAAYKWLGFGLSVFCSNVANHEDYPGAGARCAVMGSVKVSDDVIGVSRGLLK